MPTLPESDIIAKAISGDTDAFRWLVEKYRAFAFSLSYRFLGNVGDAEDIVQEAFIRLWKHLHRYRPEIKLKTWLYKIITNLCLDHLKSGPYKQNRDSRDQGAGHNVADPVLADDGILNKELLELVVKGCNLLTPKQKAVFVLRDVEQLDVNEAREILGMSQENFKSNLYHARVKMREIVSKYYKEHKNQ
jgi:RNA polymerase sigma-70 factor, ECF subfamily